MTAPTKDALYTYKATVIAFTDGDTFHLRFDLGFNTFRECRCRLARCNAPELKTPEGIVAAAATKAWLTNAAAVAPLTVQSRTLDNYGRPLVEVWSVAGRNLTDDLIASGNAVPMVMKTDDGA